jgi:hypothetical protein
MTVRPLPKYTTLQVLFDYKRSTGVLSWACGPNKGQQVGQITKMSKGYFRREVCIGRKKFTAARIIWKWMTGCDPIGEIDHKNVDSLDDRWRNLRVGTHRNNTTNKHKRAGRNGTPTASKLKGVYLIRRNKTNPWGANIQHLGELYYLGCFPTELGAHRAYVTAAKQLHGAFMRAA